MDQLIELLEQIQELAGVAIDALGQAGSEAAPEGGGAPEGPPASSDVDGKPGGARAGAGRPPGGSGFPPGAEEPPAE